MANYPLTNRKNLIKQVKKKTRTFLNFSGLKTRKAKVLLKTKTKKQKK